MPWPAASCTGPIARAGLFERLMRRHSSICQSRGLRPKGNSTARLLQYGRFLISAPFSVYGAREAAPAQFTGIR